MRTAFQFRIDAASNLFLFPQKSKLIYFEVITAMKPFRMGMSHLDLLYTLMEFTVIVGVYLPYDEPKHDGEYGI